MHVVAKVIMGLLIGAATREGVEQLIERGERREVFRQARQYADAVGKPLLVIGTPKARFGNHPCGDVTIDIDPEVQSECPYEIADIRAIPYPDHYFGAAYASHVLEHLPTIADAVKALDEMERVAEKTFIVVPHKSSIMAWIHPGHHLWITPSGDGYVIQQRGEGVTETEGNYVSLQVGD